MRKQFCLILLFIFPSVFAQDELINIMKTELDKNYKYLNVQPIPAYYINYRIEDASSYQISSSFGNLVASEFTQFRFLQILVRVGNHAFDNSHKSNDNITYFYAPLPFENVEGVKKQLWFRTDVLYKNAIGEYSKLKGSVAAKGDNEDNSPDFSKEKPEKYIEKPVNWGSLNLNIKKWEDKIVMYGNVFNDNKDIHTADVDLSIEVNTRYFVDSDGAEIVENSLIYRITVNIHTIAEDGMRLSLFKSYNASSLGDFPDDKKIQADMQEMNKTISALKKAPVADSYTGPAILSPLAAGVFFHEIFGHRIEGARLKKDMDAQTFKKKIGESVLPEDFSVTFDPQAKEYKGIHLFGHYSFDDEGVKGQKVNVVEKGILKSFLMNRTPIDGFPNSNGHGRGQINRKTVTRQSNMFIESTSAKTDKELRDLLIKEIKKQNKPYGYYFDQVEGGFTNTDRVNPNAFTVSPVIVYRVYADGRPDELVRGVDLIGTPLSMFSQIRYGGKIYDVFNGYCGAESGVVPVSTIAPALFVELIETQKKPSGQIKQFIMERP